MNTGQIRFNLVMDIHTRGPLVCCNTYMNVFPWTGLNQVLWQCSISALKMDGFRTRWSASKSTRRQFPDLMRHYRGKGMVGRSDGVICKVWPGQKNLLFWAVTLSSPDPGPGSKNMEW